MVVRLVPCRRGPIWGGMTDEPGLDPFLAALRGLIRPLVRVLIARGITAPAFYRLLKTVYVEVARDSFPLVDGKPPTDSRITLLTGVHRRDVRAILSTEGDEWVAMRAKTAIFASVIGRWTAPPDGAPTDWQPPVLSRAAFDAMVEGISRDMRPRTVLDELLRQGLVEATSDDRFAVRVGAVVGPGSEEDKLVFYAANVGDHLAAATANLLSSEPPFYERAVFYSRMTPDAVDAVEEAARMSAQQLLEEANAMSVRLQERGRSASDNDERYRLGVYFYRESATAPRRPEEPRDDRDA